MPCTERVTPARLSCAAALLLLACSSPMPPWTAQPAAATAPAAAPARAHGNAALPAVPQHAAPRAGLQPPVTVRSWQELRLQAARRMVAANPEHTYLGPVPEALLAIPVLDVSLNADGSVRRIDVAREPRQARDTVQLAKDAVHRAAPFGDVSRLPRPWVFTETFLFNDERKFKPRTLDD